MGADVGLACAGRTLHGEVAAIEREDGLDDRVDVASGAGDDQPARRAAAQQIGRRILGEPAPGREHRLGPSVDRLLLAPGAGRGSRRQRDGQSVPWVIAPGELGDDAPVVELLDDLDLAGDVGPAGRHGRRERRGPRVEREGGPALQPGPRRDVAAQRDLPALGASPGLGDVPRLAHGRALRIDREDAARVGPERERLAQPLEVPLPERLGLARVVVDRRGAEPQRIGVGGIALLLGAPGERQGEQGGLVAALGPAVGRGRADVGLDGAGDEPVAEAPGGDAVVPVVGGQVVEDLPRRRLVAPGEEVARLDVAQDRVAALLHVLGPDLVAHVERLELLDRVRARPDPEPAAHHGVEVDEEVTGEHPVDLGLADAVTGRHRREVGRLVRRVVVDVHAGVRLPARLDERAEPLERRALLGERVRPQRRVRLVHVDPPEEVVDPPRLAVAARVRLAVERIALEVEEDVAAVGAREGGERLGRHDLVGGSRVRGRALPRGAGGAGELHPRLGAQPLEGLATHAGRPIVGARELVDRADAVLAEPLALDGPHPGHEEQVAVRDDLGVARRAPPARRHVEVSPPIAPGNRLASCAELDPAVGDQRPQPRAPHVEQRHHVADPVRARRTVTEEEVDLLGARNAQEVELVGIGAELQQRRRLGATGELGVLHAPRPVGIPHEEVGEADELVGREGRLEHDAHGGVGERRCGQPESGCHPLPVGRPGLRDLGHGVAVLLARRPARAPRARRPCAPRARASRPPAPRRRRCARVWRRAAAATRTRTARPPSGRSR